MSEPIVAQVELTESSYVEAYLAYAEHKNVVSSQRKLIGVLLFVIAVGVARAWPPTPGVWTACAATLIAGWFLVRYQWVWIGKRGFAVLPAARRRYEVRFDEHGVRERGPRAEVSYAWSTLGGWFESERYLVVTGTKGMVAGFWAKAAFDPGQLDALRALFDARIETPTPSESPKKRTAWKTLLLWILLIVGFVAIYQLVKAP